MFDPGTITAAIGLATQVAGLFGGDDDAAREQNRIARQIAQRQQDISKLSEANERIRQTQSRFDFARAQRDIIRSALQQGGSARNAAAGAGVGLGSSLTNTITGQNINTAGTQLAALFENFQLGQETFGNNFKILGLERQIAALGGRSNQLAAQSQETAANANALFSLGSALIQGSNTFGSAFTSLTKGQVSNSAITSGWQPTVTRLFN